MRLTEAPKAGTKWRELRPTFISADNRLHVIRVMGVVENYVVARRTGCAPFVISIRNWSKQYVPVGRAAIAEDEK